MENSLTSYYEEIVKPTLEEFYEDKTNIRRAKLALITMYHVFDYLEEHDKKINRKFVLDNFSDFEILGNAANVTKHCKITRNNPVVENIDQIQQTNNVGLFAAPFGSGYFAETNGVIIVFDNHLKKDPICVSDLLTRANHYFSTLIYPSN